MVIELQIAINRMHRAVQRYEFATLHVPYTNHEFWRNVNIELRSACDALRAFRHEV